jgi:hypothetical protein
MVVNGLLVEGNVERDVQKVTANFCGSDLKTICSIPLGKSSNDF